MSDAPIDPVDAILMLKRQLADAILAVSAGMPITVAARRLGIDPARMCDLRRGRIARFSVERLIRILATVDRSVTLTVVQTSFQPVCWFPKLRAKRDARLLGGRRGKEPVSFPAVL
jgi:predicted XRE-type DNA-binding protein